MFVAKFWDLLQGARRAPSYEFSCMCAQFLLCNSRKYYKKTFLFILFRNIPDIWHFRYCCPVRGTAGITALQKLHKSQNQAARSYKQSLRCHSDPIIQKLRWPTIKQLIESETAKVVYKALHNEASDYLKGLFFIGCPILKVGRYAIPILIYAHSSVQNVFRTEKLGI